jgi:hypothetical protein
MNVSGKSSMEYNIPCCECGCIKLEKSNQEGMRMNVILLKLYVKFQDLKDREDGQTMVE